MASSVLEATLPAPHTGALDQRTRRQRMGCSCTRINLNLPAKYRYLTRVECQKDALSGGWNFALRKQQTKLYGAGDVSSILIRLHIKVDELIFSGTNAACIYTLEERAH